MTLIAGDTALRFTSGFGIVLCFMLIFCQGETVIICLLSSFLHEMGHLYFIRSFHLKVKAIVWGAFGIRIECLPGSKLSYQKEALIASGGILINFLVAIFSYLYYYLFHSGFLLRLCAVNLLLALFNMMPVSVLDMGRIISCISYGLTDTETSQRVVRLVSAVFCALLICFCIYFSFFVSVNVSLICVTAYISLITLKELK